MTDKLSAIWDGEQHWLEPGELFPTDGATKVIDGWEELEEEDELSPFESPSVAAVLRETRTRPPDSRFPLAQTEQAWGSLSIALTAFADIAEVSKKQYQHVWPGQGSVKGEVKWSFTMTTEDRKTERL